MSMLGKTAKCSKCGAEFKIRPIRTRKANPPSLAASPDDKYKLNERDSGTEEWSGPPKAKEVKAAMPQQTCPNCGTRLLMTAVVCTNCGYSFQTRRVVGDPLYEDLAPDLRSAMLQVFKKGQTYSLMSWAVINVLVGHLVIAGLMELFALKAVADLFEGAEGVQTMIYTGVYIGVVAYFLRFHFQVPRDYARGLGTWNLIGHLMAGVYGAMILLIALGPFLLVMYLGAGVSIDSLMAGERISMAGGQIFLSVVTLIWATFYYVFGLASQAVFESVNPVRPFTLFAEAWRAHLSVFGVGLAAGVIGWFLFMICNAVMGDSISGRWYGFFQSFVGMILFSALLIPPLGMQGVVLRRRLQEERRVAGVR